MSPSPDKIILVPIDFSEASFQAIETALGMANDASHVHALHVLTPMMPSDPGVVWDVVSFQERKDHAKKALLRSLEGHGIDPVNTHVTEGNPGREIIVVAEEIDAKLIIIPSHGRTGLRRLLIGSVAERVVRLAPCPVLVLRRPLKD